MQIEEKTIFYKKIFYKVLDKKLLIWYNIYCITIYTLFKEEKMTALHTDMPLHLFHHGTNYKSYETFGAHPTIQNGKKGTPSAYGPRVLCVFPL